MSRLKFEQGSVEEFNAFLDRFSTLVEADIADDGENAPAYLAAFAACGDDRRFEAYSLWLAARQGV